MMPSMRMFRVRNKLAREALAEFFGTFILMVSVYEVNIIIITRKRPAQARVRELIVDFFRFI